MPDTQRTQLMANTMARSEGDAVLEDRFNGLDDSQLALQPCLEITGVVLAAK